MTRLVLLRHGNTFTADQTAVWVGARTDLPLTPEGQAQAKTAAGFIARTYPDLATIISGPLLRTKQTAAAVADTLKLNVEIHLSEALREIDYGAWEGLSNDAIAQHFGAKALADYQERDIWPEAFGGTAAQETYRQRVASFLNTMRQNYPRKTCCVVTSNGILRIIHGLITGQPAGNAAKVKTGHLCVLTFTNNVWEIINWNESP